MTAVAKREEGATEPAFPAIWLRDNCRCAQCVDTGNEQKLFQITDLPPQVAVVATERDETSLRVTFAPDGHRGVFPLGWLAAQGSVTQDDGRSEASKQLWLARDLEGRLPVADWAAYSGDDAEKLRVLRFVARLGFALLRGTPPKEGTVLEVARSFGFVRETNYGELFDVRVELAPNNLAFTGLAIGPHTDNPYRDPVPTLQLLHCLTSAVAGGDSGLVDGFRAAATLRDERPEAFAVLSRTCVPFAWSDPAASLRALRPLIETDGLGRVRGVRFNNRSMQALASSSEELTAFYDAYRSFAELLIEPGRQVGFRLEPGDCVIFDNTRLLHSRSAFSDTTGGSRHLQGCYADIDGLLSSIAVLERSLGQAARRDDGTGA